MKIPLNKAQQQAVDIDDRSLLIVAGAGTGKTHVLTEKVSSLLQKGIDPKHILMLTFTNKAADEIRERVVSSYQSDMPFIGTFHSFCVLLLREFYTEAGVNKNFTIFDQGETRSIVKKILKSHGIDSPSPRVVHSLISKVKTGMPTLNEPEAYIHIVEEILPIYTLMLEQEKAVDFDDLILKTISLLQHNKAVRESVQGRFSYILIDEYQDTDTLQNTIVKILQSVNTHVIAVGDTDQTIYSWRGANVHNMLSFGELYQPSETILLTQNYRSTGTILSAANTIISKNTMRQEKELSPTRGEGGKITLMQSTDENNEAETVSNMIQSLHREGIEYGDIAILFRANFQARAFESQLIVDRVPYTVLGTRFFDRAEIKGLVAYLTLIINPTSQSAFSRAVGIPKRGIGATTLQRIFNNQESSLSPAAYTKVSKFRADLKELHAFAEKNTVFDTLKHLLSHLSYETYLRDTFDNPNDRMREVGELLTFSQRFSHFSGLEGISKLLEEVALGSDQDSLRIANAQHGVRLMTVHAAKGLEFPCVFLVGMEEGLFPFLHDDYEQHDEEEERRLCYVAVTRAKDRLFCSYASRRGFFGTYRPMLPSSFLLDIPEELTAVQDPSTEGIDIEW